MNTRNVILMIVAAAVLLPLVGCQENSRTASAERRWQHVMEQARLEAAQLSIEQGRLAYAQRILEDLVESESALAPQARLLLEELHAVSQQFAAARNAAEIESPEHLQLN